MVPSTLSKSFLNDVFSNILENKTPSRAMLRPKRRLNAWCAVDCARGPDSPRSCKNPVTLLLLL